MGQSYFSSAQDRKDYKERMKLIEDTAENARREFAAKIVMVVVDKIVADVVRPGPVPEERECYEMAGEIRALVPELETLVTKIIKNQNET